MMIDDNFIRVSYLNSRAEMLYLVGSLKCLKYKVKSIHLKFGKKRLKVNLKTNFWINVNNNIIIVVQQGANIQLSNAVFIFVLQLLNEIFYLIQRAGKISYFDWSGEICDCTVDKVSAGLKKKTSCGNVHVCCQLESVC